jgi:hypothetical protein
MSKGSMIAFALAGLFAAGGCSSEKKEAGSQPAAKSAEASVKCMGVNACQGQGGCKSAANECKGHNGCKGKGFVEMSADDCAAKGGKAM